MEGVLVRDLKVCILEGPWKGGKLKVPQQQASIATDENNTGALAADQSAIGSASSGPAANGGAAATMAGTDKGKFQRASDIFGKYTMEDDD